MADSSRLAASFPPRTAVLWVTYRGDPLPPIPALRGFDDSRIRRAR